MDASSFDKSSISMKPSMMNGRSNKRQLSETQMQRSKQQSLYGDMIFNEPSVYKTAPGRSYVLRSVMRMLTMDGWLLILCMVVIVLVALVIVCV